MPFCWFCHEAALFVSFPFNHRHNDKKKNWYKRRTSFEKWLIVICLGALVVVAVLAVKLSNLHNETNDDQQTIETGAVASSLEKHSGDLKADGND